MGFADRCYLRRTVGACLFIASLWWRVPVFAQEAPSPPTEPVSDLTGLSLEELVQVRLLTASRHLDDPRKAPAAITVIGSDEIARYGWRTLGDLLRSVPGLYTASSLTNTYLGVRGFLQPGDFNARVLLLVDGHRINDNLEDMATLGFDFPLDLSVIDHVEVLRGTGASLYGNNAELAIVNVLTRRSEVRPAFHVSSEADSFLGRAVEVRGSFRSGTLSGMVEGSIYRENGPQSIDLPGIPSLNAAPQTAVDEDGDRTDHLYGSISRGGLRIEGMFGRRDKLIPGAPETAGSNGPVDRESTDRGTVDASYSRDFGPRTQWDLRSYYDFFQIRSDLPSANTQSGGQDYEITTGKASWLGFETVLSRHVGKHRLVAGAQGEDDLNLSQSRAGIPGKLQLQEWMAAVFAEAELNFGPHLTVSLGGREDMSRLDPSAFSPRVAVMYFPGQKTSVKYIFGRAYRTPDPNSRFCPANSCSSTAPSLEPEHTRSDVLTFEEKINARVSLSATGFRNEITNLIEQPGDETGPGSGFSNNAGDRGKGLELEASVKLPRDWSGRSSYTFTRSGTIETRSPLEYSPAHLGKLNVSSPLFGSNSLGIELQYNSSELSGGGNHISPLFLSNVTLLSRPLWGGLRISASCYDCLDRKAAPVPETDPAMPLSLGVGRTWRIRLDYRQGGAKK